MDAEVDNDFEPSNGSTNVGREESNSPRETSVTAETDDEDENSRSQSENGIEEAEEEGESQQVEADGGDVTEDEEEVAEDDPKNGENVEDGAEDTGNVTDEERGQEEENGRIFADEESGDIEDEDEGVEAGDRGEADEECERKMEEEPAIKEEQMEDEYYEDFLSIPVQCDLQEGSEGTVENGDSGSDYSAGEVEDNNDEDYKPKSRSRRSRKHRTEFDDDLPEETSEELREAYRLFLDVQSCAGTHFLNHPALDNGVADYLDIIEKPMWLEEIKRRFLIGDYSRVEDFVTDVRLVLENCYRYFGRDNPHTKKALKIEQFYTQKVAALPKKEQSKFLLDPLVIKEEVKEDEDSDNSDRSPKRKEFHSSLLERFGDEKQRREEERKMVLLEERKLATSDIEKEKVEWEKETLLANGAYLEMKSMWEIPQISQILQLTRSSLCIEDLPHYEVERMLLMPQSSKLLAVLMTSLLSPPISRAKLQTHPPMPYSIWSKKLAQRVAFWYKSYNHRNKDPLKAFQYLGIESEFWSVLGDWNQLEDYEFHELSFHQRVWIIKSLCDYLMHHHKTMHDILAEHSPEDQICSFLGEDREGRQYLHFPIFTRGGDAVRVYRQRRHLDDWAPEPVEAEKKTAKKKGTKRGSKKFGRGSSAKRKEKRKKLYNFSSLNFISRNTYRMPYSLHAGRKCRKRRAACGGRLAETASNLNSEKREPEVPFEENADCSPTNSPEVSQDGHVFRTRSRRSSRNKYQANYLDWSDSDEEQTAEKSPSTRSKSAFSAISEETKDSKSDEHIGEMVTFASVPESSVVDDATQDASLLSDEGASRSSLCKDEKNSVKGEESEADEDEDDEMPDISRTKIEEDDYYGLWLTRSADKKATRRPRYDPTWLLQGTEYFELVADSVQGIRDLIDSFSDEDDMDLMHRINNSETKSKGTPERKLKKALLHLLEELEPIELRLERSVRLTRSKMYQEWFEWRLRGEDFKDAAEMYWLSLLDPVERAPPVLTPQVEAPPLLEKCDIKKENVGESNSISGEVENSNAPSEATTQSEEAGVDGEVRHTRRSKRRVEPNGILGDSFQSVWSDEMSSEESERNQSDHDDAWEMPSKRKRKKTRLPKKRPPPKEGQEEGEEQQQQQQVKKAKKKGGDKTAQVKKRLWSTEEGPDGDRKTSTVSINDGLHSKLTLDKQGNLFITMSSGQRIPLEKDDEGRIRVPDGLPKFAVLNGKTLQQLFGENRVIPKAIRRKECSTTLFPALPLPTVYTNRTKDEKEAGTSGSQSPKTPEGINDPSVDLTKLIANKVTIQKTKAPGEPRVYPSSSKSKTPQVVKGKRGDDDIEVIATKNKAKPTEADIVYLSDGSDDSIELIQETTPTKPTIPRIEKVVGNAKIDLPPTTLKNISKSVTMSPVLPRHITPTKNMTPPKENQWKPVITSSRSLSSTRMPSPGGATWKGQRQVISNISPEVQITTTRKPTTQRNLSVYRTPNQAFVPVTSLPARPAQSDFVPVNQFVPVVNQYNSSNQFQPVNNQFVPLNSQSMVSVSPQPPRVRMLAGNTTITPLPSPARTQSQSERSPTLSGQIVLVNTDKGFSYAVKLADGGTIFLTPEQVAKIREANSGKLTTMVTLHTN